MSHHWLDRLTSGTKSFATYRVGSVFFRIENFASLTRISRKPNFLKKLNGYRGNPELPGTAVEFTIVDVTKVLCLEHCQLCQQWSLPAGFVTHVSAYLLAICTTLITRGRLLRASSRVMDGNAE